MFSLSGCFSSFGNRIDILNKETKTEKQFIKETETQILDAIKNNDRGTLKSVFSQKALSEAKDLEIGLDYLFSLYQGEFLEITNRNHGVFDHLGTPGRTKEISAYCIFQTDKKTYILNYDFWPIQEADSSAKGVYTIRLREYFEGITGKDYGRAGIYHPEWDENS
jgi:hypothetical protein